MNSQMDLVEGILHHNNNSELQAIASEICRWCKICLVHRSESISPFCDYPGSPTSLYRCNLQRTGVSNCNRGTFSGALPAEYQVTNCA